MYDIVFMVLLLLIGSSLAGGEYVGRGRRKFTRYWPPFEMLSSVPLLHAKFVR